MEDNKDMTESEVLTILNAQVKNSSTRVDSSLLNEAEGLTRRYNQEPYGNETDGRSQVVASDVYELVESDMPELARVFLGPSSIMEFKSRGEADKEEADQKTKYADFLIRQQRDSFKTLHDWMKSAGLSRFSVVKYYAEETEQVEYHKYKDVSDEELAEIKEGFEKESSFGRLEVEESGEDENTVKIRVYKKTKKIKISGVPPESFLMTAGATDKESAELVGDESLTSKGDLIKAGYDEKLVMDLLPTNEDGMRYKRERFKDSGGYDLSTGYHWQNEKVLLQNLYSKIDIDGDGIPERRYIVKSGNTILSNEPHSHEPYAILSQIMVPYSAIGKTRSEQAAKSQKEKTAIKRGINDNIYSVSRPRLAVDDSPASDSAGVVDLDDAMSQRNDGIIRTQGSPHQSIMPVVTPYIGQQAMQVIQYIDNVKSQALGSTMASQGLNADSLYNETATRFEGVQDSQKAKIELVARVFAETGFRELYEGVIWTAQHYQDETTEIEVLGEPLSVDPEGWKYEHYCVSSVGVGAGDSDEMIANISGIISDQTQLLANNSPMVDYEKMYNSRSDLVRLMGKSDPNRYYNDPSIEEQTIYAHNIAMTQMVAQLEQQLQAMQNPMAEAEMIRAQAKMAEVKARMVEAESKGAGEMRKFILTMAQEDSQFAAGLAKDLTELELKYQQDVPGALV